LAGRAGSDNAVVADDEIVEGEEDIKKDGKHNGEEQDTPCVRR
jgi:hypothetical protein